MQVWPKETREAKALLTLREQVNTLAPDRNKSSDGIEASKKHHAVNPNSDHEPHVMDGNVGVFTAIDISNDPGHGVSSRALAQAILDSKDERVKYVISNAEIASGSGQEHTQGEWRPYHGPNDHRHHCHISLKGDKALYDSKANWDLSKFSVGDADPDHAARPLLKQGDTGRDVRELQELLGVAQDGTFGWLTRRAVITFQRQHGLKADGRVGPYTWDALEHAKPQVPKASPPLPQVVPPPPPPPNPNELNDAIMQIAAESRVQQYNWLGRGISPPGYVKGMALSFARVYRDLKLGKDYAALMAKAPGSIDNDALVNFAQRLHDIGSTDSLLSVFVILMGLGMRESSGRYCCGRDTSAGKSSMSSDAAEAGLFQVSWNSRVAHPLLPKLMQEYNEDGLRSVYHEGVACSALDNQNYGSGIGSMFQSMCKQKPDFAVRYAGCLLRYMGGHKQSHWGPIRRREMEVRKEALELFEQVRELINKQELVS